MSVSCQLSPASSRAARPGRDVGGEDRLGEEHGLDSLLPDELRDRVDARLRERRLELRVVGDVDRRGAVRGRLVGETVEARADDHARDVARAQRRCLRENRERALLELAAVVLEEDEGRII